MAAVLAVLLIGCASAGAAPVTIGADLSATPTATFSCGFPGGCTYAQASPSFESPVSGVIVRWRVLDSSGPLTLRVLHENEGVLSSAAETPTSLEIQEFPADLPIVAGQRIGVDLPTGFVSNIGVYEPPSSVVQSWTPALGNGAATAPGMTFPDELLLNAEVRQPPGITAVSPTFGTVGAANPVVISGHDFTGASAVSFGSTSAPSFTVDSDERITAVSPSSSTTGTVDVTVTTVAGTTPIVTGDRYSYQSRSEEPMAECIVPKLKDKGLKAAKRALKAADCELGILRGKQGKTARVKSQRPKPGKVVPAGSKVGVKLRTSR